MIDANPIIERFNSRVFGYILLVLVVVFHSLVIAGCMSKSSGIPGLYIVKLQISNSSSVQVRVGYFAMCVNGPLNSPYECYSTTGLGQDKLRSFFITENMDATTSSQISQLLVPARAMQTRVFPPLIAGAFGCFMASVMLAAVRQNMLAQPSPRAFWTSRHTSAIIACLGVLAFGLAAASAVMTTQVAKALAWWLNDMDPQENGIYISEGTGMQVLQWLIVSMIILYHLCFAHLFTDKTQGVEEKAEAPDAEA
ncbi:hypothetical protein Cpir12675_000019 [Ceratocystis pirilliformis]|uniref:Uncharacterized protein n=1 Tax=Ceratocystis pirilliformis TaxID=259994 RepID=A0ABR3ZN57_9PEZI